MAHGLGRDGVGERPRDPRSGARAPVRRDRAAFFSGEWPAGRNARNWGRQGRMPAYTSRRATCAPGGYARGYARRDRRNRLSYQKCAVPVSGRIVLRLNQPKPARNKPAMPGRGKKAWWSDDDQRVRSTTGGYPGAILTLERTLATMRGLQGDELRRYAGRYCTSMPELAEAIGKLHSLERQAQQHFRNADLRSPRPGAVAQERDPCPAEKRSCSI